MITNNQLKTGALDLLWDERRGVWTCHDFLKGIVEILIPANNTDDGEVRIYKDNESTSWLLKTRNWFDFDILVGQKVDLIYNVVDNKW